MTYAPWRGLGSMGDGEVNPDGSPTYDSAPYSPNDPANPYNLDNFASTNYGPYPSLPTVTVSGPALPTTIPLSVTPFGTDTTVKTLPVNYVQPAPPTTGYTALPTQAAPVPVTGIATFLSSLFGTKTPAPVTSYSAPVRTAGVALPSSSGLSTTTLLLLAAVGGAILLASKRRA